MSRRSACASWWPVVAVLHHRPLYVGHPFTSGTANDLVVWPLEEAANVAPLKLAAADAKINEWVWAVGQEVGKPTAQKMFRCKVTGSELGGLTLQQYDHFEMRGFSGGPVVNAGEVVGNLLGGTPANMIPVAGMRQRLASAKIELP